MVLESCRYVVLSPFLDTDGACSALTPKFTAQDFPQARERLEELKRAGKNGPRQRERITRSKIGQQNEGECSVM